MATRELIDVGSTTVYSVTRYSDLDTAISTIGATVATLLIDDATTMTASVTIPSTLSVKVLKGGIITKSSGTLTINGPFECGRYQVFSGFSAGDITFGAGRIIYPEWWGAVSDGSAASDAAITLAVYVVTTQGGTLDLDPGGTYLLSSSINITETDPEIPWEIRGHWATLKQSTNNTQIFNMTLASNYAAQWWIYDIIAEWSSDQSAANTNSIVYDLNNGSWGFYNCGISGCYHKNGYRMIEGWAFGWTLDRLWHGANCTGAMIYAWAPSGVPNVRLTNSYCNAWTPSEAVIQMQEINSLYIHELEINLTNKTFIHLASCREFHIGHLSTEATLSAGGTSDFADDQAILLDGCWGRIDYINFQTYVVPDDFAIVRGQNASANGVEIGAILDSGNQLVGGSGTFWHIAGGAGLPWIIHKPGILASGANSKRWDETAGTLPFTRIQVLNPSALTTFEQYKGDEDFTLTVFDSPVNTYISVTATANRTITLDTTDNYYVGAEFTIARTAATPGAFTYAVKSGSGGSTIYTFPASENRTATFVATQFGWVVKAASPSL